MHTGAVLASVFLLSGMPAMGQAVPSQFNQPQLRPDPATTLCETRIQPGDGKTPGPGTITVCKTTMVPACPIDMHVRQGIGGGMIAVDENGMKRRVFAPRLRLFLNDLRPGKSDQQIISAKVTVHGSNGKARVHPVDANADSDAGGNGDLKSGVVQRTLNVDLGNWGEPGASGDFRLPGFISTSRVDLESVTYQDGSTWKLSGTETCHVAPDFLMLVSR